MWISGVIADRFANFTGVRDILDADVSDSYGIDTSGSYPLDDDTVEVTVSEINVPLTEEEMENLKDSFDPLSNSSDYGIDLFIQSCLFCSR